jgi:PAS domain S-box-containing protein
MPKPVSPLLGILNSPFRILAIVLALVFAVEAVVMLILPYLVPGSLGEFGTTMIDAGLLTLICAPLLWLVIIGPLRRIALQEQQRSQTIVANAGEAIVTFDQQGTVLSGNPAATNLFGIEFENLIGSSLESLLADWSENIASSATEFRSETSRPNGVSIPIQVSISQFPSDTGALRIAILRDLTASQRAEREQIAMARQTEALRAQQMTTLAQLATGVAHEIRNPLTSIKMLIQVNQSKLAQRGLPTDDLELVEREIRRMERSVNSLLEYARPESSEFANFSIQESIRRTVQLIEGRCKSQHVQLKIVEPEDPLVMYGDLAQIQQLLLNLSLNALDAMPAGGTLTIQVDDRTLEQREIVVSVSDTGSGISDSIQDNLFDPFITTKPNGVGLGLGICKRIAEAHGGTISAMNNPNGGAILRLQIPVEFAEQMSIQPAP